MVYTLAQKPQNLFTYYTRFDELLARHKRLAYGKLASKRVIILFS